MQGGSELSDFCGLMDAVVFILGFPSSGRCPSWVRHGPDEGNRICMRADQAAGRRETREPERLNSWRRGMQGDLLRGGEKIYMSLEESTGRTWAEWRSRHCRNAHDVMLGIPIGYDARPRTAALDDSCSRTREKLNSKVIG